MLNSFIYRKRSKHRQSLIISLLLLLVFFCSGCDVIYRILQPAGAEEREILGEIVPFEKNRKVETVQRLLKLYGYRIGNVDGVLGANTRDSIKAFQENSGLETTRFVDYATWDKLTYFERIGLVVDGEVSVFALQTALKESGFDIGRIDGKLGPRTKQAIVEFQEKEGLIADGKVGFRTIKALSAYLPQEVPQKSENPR